MNTEPSPTPESAILEDRATTGQLVDADKRPPGVEIVRDAPDVPPGKILVRPIAQAEGFRRLAAKLQQRETVVPPETDAERHAREVREADVINAARRSQAEIRRHVDAYLKEHFEEIAADVAAIVVDRVHGRLLRGLGELAETQQIQLDRIAASMRAQLRAFARGAWGKETTQRARRAPGARRAKKR